ncbi:PAS domain-containing protein [Ferrimonas marina]|uniref:PAS domain-containing protein n=1 Tax=Ferrimonas marina TaxID=299255 RepID=UPI00082B57A3|nr:PAS domain-containing protein [Ferrimonas marina]
MPPKDDSQFDIASILAKFEHADNHTLKRPPFALQLLLMVLLVMGITHALLHFNSQRLDDHLASRRFAEMQVFSDRINDAIQRQGSSIQLVGQYGLPQLQQGNIDDEQGMLHELKRRFSNYVTLALLDADSNVVMQVGESPNLRLSRKELQAEAAQLDPDEVFKSPVMLDGRHNAAYQWLLAPVEENPSGVTDLLAVVDISTVWEGFYTLNDNDSLPLLLVGADGQCLNLTQRGKEQQRPIHERFPALWQHMQENSFGEFSLDERLFVYMQLRPGKEHPLYLLSYIDRQGERPIENRFRSQIYLSALTIVVLLARLMWYRRYQLDDRQGRQRSLALAEQLYEGKQGAMLFSTAGICQSANRALCDQLNTSTDRLAERHFRRLFDSAPLSIDMVWQLARSSGYWEGQLLPRHGVSHPLKVSIRSLRLGRNDQLMVLRIEESPQQRQQNEQLRELRQLSDSACGLALVDSQQTILACNNAMAQICGHNQEAIRGLNWQELLPLANAEMSQTLRQQLNTRGSWQGPLWLTRRDGGYLRCLANVHLAEGYHGDEPYQVVSLTPLQDAQLGDHIAQPPLAKHNLQRCLTQFQDRPVSLMMLRLDPQDPVASFSDSDAMLFQQHQLEHALVGILPKEALLGQHSKPGELHVLLPGWSDSKATRLAANLLRLLDEAELAEGLVIGLAAGEGESNWQTLLENADMAIERAKANGHSYCQAFTRQSA